MAADAFSADSKWMTGDWGGERTKLIEQGIDIKADYEAKHGTLGAGAPKVFFKYFYVNSQTGEASVPMQALATYAAAAEDNGDGE